MGDKLNQSRQACFDHYIHTNGPELLKLSAYLKYVPVKVQTQCEHE